MFTPIQHHPDWRPPFCPNPICRFHGTGGHHWRYKKSGYFGRQARPHRIQRFTCSHCLRSFSTQTFSTTYWQRLPQLDALLLLKSVGGMANRQMARDLGVAPATIDRHTERLGRHCLLLHAKMMQDAKPISHMVIDGLVTFERSQYQPFHFHLAVEKGTDFIPCFTDSEVRRSGTMTEFQKRYRAEFERQHGRPDPQAVRKDMRELLDIVIGSQVDVTIDSDDHKAYPAAMRGLAPRIRHRVTSSKARRDTRNPLWEANLADGLIRHSSANHKREAIAFSKRRQSAAEKLAVFVVWRNYVKGRREKVRGSPTPAMARGMTDRAWTVQDVLAARLFPTLVQLPGRWRMYYERGIETRGTRNRVERPRKYAF